MTTVRCARCTGELRDRRAAIAFFAAGNENIGSFFFCAPCDSYTVEVYCDHFLGNPEVWVRGPLARGEGDRLLGEIAKCPDPTNKFCDCETHLSWCQK